MTPKEKVTITAVDLIKRHEGSVMHKDRHIVYTCPAGYKTIGHGRNLETNGLSVHEAEFLLYNDIDECEKDLLNIFGKRVTPNRLLLVLLDMRFALGYSEFRKWKRLIAGVKNNSIPTVIKEIKDSKWYRGMGKNRCKDLISILNKEE